MLHEDPTIPLLGIYPKDAPAYHKDKCSTMFIAALFIVARNWNQPRHSSAKEYIQKRWFIFIMENYSAIKNKGIMNFPGKWIDVENILLSEFTQTQNGMYSFSSRY